MDTLWKFLLSNAFGLHSIPNPNKMNEEGLIS